ncbi:MAG: peptidase domain protein [Deltaproteobacteria bacterium]|nr:peptidase domain protein [Deltaproteobacteria bacterium]
MGTIGKHLVSFAVAVLFLLPVPARAAGDRNIGRTTLKNGLRVVVVRNTLAPVVTTEVNYLAGSNEAPEGFPGTAHAEEHMMFRGSPGLSATQFSTISAALGGESNADTQQVVTQYFLTVPSDALDTALRIESIRMRAALNTDALWKLERGAIEQEVAQDLSNPEYIFYVRLLEALFAGTPYAHDALGTRPSFDKTTGAMLDAFHRSWYGPNNAILVIVGDVDPGRALALVRRHFGPIPRRVTPPRPEVRLKPLKPEHIELDTDLPYGLAAVAYRLPGYKSTDFAAGQVLADALDSRRGNLYGLVPEGTALSAGFDGDALPEAAFGYSSAAFPPGGNGAALVSAMKGIVAGYLETGIPPALVEAAKRREIADAEFRKNSVEGLASAWSQALAVEGRSSPDDDTEAIRKVTVEDVNRVAREYLVNETAITAILTPRPSGAPVSGNRFGSGESFSPERAKAARLPAWAKGVVTTTPVLPASRVKPADLLLPNGLRLIVQPETISRTVTVSGRIRSAPGLQTPEGKEGVDRVLDDLFPYGTATLDRLSFQEAQDNIAATVSAGTDFSLRVPAEAFDRGVRLLADNLLHPSLPEGAFRVVRRQVASAVAGDLDSPEYLSRRALRTGLYPAGDPALRHPTPATVEGLSLEDVRAYHGKVFRPDMTTIVVVGDVTPERAKEVVASYFGGWKAAGPKPETDLPPVPPNAPASAAVPDASRVQDEVMLAQTLGVTRSDPDYYTLQVGNHVLAGAFYATRLYRDLREETGLVYVVQAMLDAGKTRAAYSVFYGCDPGNVSRARALVERDLREMQTTPVSADELRQAKTLLIRKIPLSEASVDGIAGTLLDLSQKELPLDEPVRAAERYRRITAEQVREAFRKWVRPADFVQVTLGPEGK